MVRVMSKNNETPARTLDSPSRPCRGSASRHRHTCQHAPGGTQTRRRRIPQSQPLGRKANGSWGACRTACRCPRQCLQASQGGTSVANKVHARYMWRQAGKRKLGSMMHCVPLPTPVPPSVCGRRCTSAWQERASVRWCVGALVRVMMHESVRSCVRRCVCA